MTSRKLNLVVGSLVLLLAAAIVAHGRPGDIDAGFGDRGRVSTSYPPLVGRGGNLSLINFDGTAVTVIDANGKPVPGAGFAIPRTNGLRTIYSWENDAEDGYLISVTTDTAEGVQSGILHLDAQGRPDPGFGTGGIAVVQDASRRLGAYPGPYQLQSLLIEVVRLLGDGKILLLVMELPYPSCLKSWGLAVMPDFDECWGWIGVDRPVPYFMLRLQSDGHMDESFGEGGWVRLDGISGGVTLVTTLTNGSPVLVDGSGQIRAFTPDGSPSFQSRVTFWPTTGDALPDGGLLLVGHRDEAPRGVWVTRMDARLQPVIATGATSGETRLDLAALYSGDTSGESYTGWVRLSPDGRYAYLPASFVNATDSRGRCGGVARLKLEGEPVFDESFGRHGMACLLPDQPNGVRVLPSGDVLLVEGYAPDIAPRSPSLYRLHAQDVPGPGFIRFTGAVYGLNYAGSVDEGAGTVTLRAKRMAGKAGPVSVEWRIIETKGNPSISGAQSGRLEWADGDDADKAFTLALIDDLLPYARQPPQNTPHISSATLALKPVDTLPTSAVVSESTYQLQVLDNDSLPTNTQVQAIEPGGGGGALGPWALLAVGALWRRRRHSISNASGLPPEFPVPNWVYSATPNLLLALLAMVVPPVFAGPGELDVRFANHGWRDIPEMDSIVAAIPLPDGSVVVVGHKWPTGAVVLNPYPDVQISRIDPVGTTLWTRSPGKGYAGTVARLRNGRILVGSSSYDPSFPAGIIALQENGDVDTGFGNQGWTKLEKSQIVSGAGNSTVDVELSSIREMADGSLLVSGSVSNDTLPWDWSPASQAMVIRLGTDGALLDPPRQADLLFQERRAASAQPVGDGRSLVLAANGCCTSKRGLLLSRDASGELAETPSSHDSRLTLGALVYDEANRRFYAQGAWNSNPVLVAGDATGALDLSFGANGTGRVALLTFESAWPIVDEDGSVVTFRTRSGDDMYEASLRETPHAQFFVGRLNRSGLPDPGIDNNVPVPLADPEGSSTTWNFRVATGAAGFAWTMAEVGSAETSYGPDPAARFNQARLAKLQLGKGSGRGTLGFQFSSIRVGEQGPAQLVRVVRSGGSSGAVGARYAVTSSPAGAGDLKTTSGILTWPDGDATARTIEIAAQDDALLEGEERYTFSLLDPAGGVEIADVPLLVTVEDDEALALLTAEARSPKIIAGQSVEFVLRLQRPVPGPVSVMVLVGDSVDANGEWPLFFGTTNSRRVRQTMRWIAGDTGERVIRLQTDVDTDSNHSVDLHLRLSSAAGLVRQAADLGTAVVGAKITVTGGALPPTVITEIRSDSGAMEGGGSIGAGALMSLLMLFLRRRRAQPESPA